jgi:hypothetical protein
MISDLKLSLSRCVGETAVNLWFRRDEINERKWAKNDGEQNQKRHLLHGPKRRDVGRVKKLLRGKSPGNPG